MAALDVLFREHGIMGVGHTDLLQTAPADRPRNSEGMIGWMRDGFGGLRLYTYRKNISGSAMAKGDLVSRRFEVETNQTGTVATSITGSTTADDHIGSLAIVHDDAGGAGAAPEGEASIVASNTATVWTLEGDLPFSAALASGDDITFVGPKVVDAAANDPNYVVCGIAMSTPADDEWGWFQFQGLHPAAAHTAVACVAGSALKAGAAALAVYGDATAVVGGTAGTGIAYVVAVQVAIHGSDVVTTKSPVVMQLLGSYL
mgnify:CR=1 FL=1